jgi:hypothetical protein
VHAERGADLVVGARLVAEMLAQPLGERLRAPPARRVGGVAAEREHAAVALGHGVGAEPRSPHLHERRLLPAGGPDLPHPGRQRQQRRPRHAVLQSGERRGLDRARPGGQPRVERADAPAEREDLVALERQRGARPHTLEQYAL